MSKRGASNSTTGELVVVSQTGLREEEFFRKSGLQSTVHVVVKAHVFYLEMAAADGESLPDGLRWETTLAYDADEADERRLVPVVKVAPVKHTAKHSLDGSVTLSCKLTVLTSQHENLFFRVLVRGETKGKGAGKSWEGESHPIRVISKPESTTKKKRARSAAPERPAELPASLAEETLAEVGELQLAAQELLRRLEHYEQQEREQEAGRVHERKRLALGPALGDTVQALGRLPGAQERRRHVEHVLGLLPSHGPLLELRQMSDAGAGRGGGGRFQAGDSLMPMNVGNDGMVSFNDLFVAVPPAPAVSTTVNIDGHDFDILDFGIGEASDAGCTCTNCNYKSEAERMDVFSKESGLI